MLPSILICVGAYLLGSVLFAELFARRRGIDLSQIGSGNPGATNAARAMGRRVGRYVLLLDFAKGAAVALLATYWFEELPRALAPFLCVLGHCYPFHRWPGGRAGGKGVATSLGVLLVCVPPAGLAALLTFGITKRQTGFTSLGSLLGAGAAVSVTLATYFFDLLPSLPMTLMTVGLFSLILWRHRTNIRRLREGTEPREGDTR